MMGLTPLTYCRCFACIWCCSTNHKRGMRAKQARTHVHISNCSMLWSWVLGNFISPYNPMCTCRIHACRLPWDICCMQYRTRALQCKFELEASIHAWVVSTVHDVYKTFDSLSVIGNITKLLRKKVKPNVATILIASPTNELSNSSSAWKTSIQRALVRLS